MSKPFFTPKDFETAPTVFGDRYKAAEIANAKLKKALGPEVYAASNKEGTYRDWSEDNYPGTEIVARLFNIQKIVREPCKHEPSWNGMKTHMSVDRFYNRFAHVESVCMNCGIALVAKFEEKK